MSDEDDDKYNFSFEEEVEESQGSKETDLNTHEDDDKEDDSKRLDDSNCQDEGGGNDSSLDPRLALDDQNGVASPPLSAERRYTYEELPTLLKKLKLFADDNQTRLKKTVEELRKEELDAFIGIYEARFPTKQIQLHIPKLSQMPKFYDPLPQEENVLKSKLREEARTLLLQKKSAEVLSSDALEALFPILDKHISPPFVGEEKMMNYNAFLEAAKQAGNRCSHYFTAHNFAALLEGDPYGRLSINTFFKYIMRREWLKQAHIGLSLYDASGQGFLREADLETYIYELIPTMPQLKHLQAMFLPFYVCTATRKLIFFLDPMRTGKVRIIDILISGFLDDLLELREEEVPEEKLHINWFSAPSAFRVYSQFLSMDKDRNGMLSRDELAGYGNGTLTSVFLDRLFQECLTFGGEMDYKIYMDFVLAMENKDQPRSIAFFFRIFDIRHKGYLDPFDLNYFFREIQDQWKHRGEEMVTFEDVKDEIYDMVKPQGVDKTHIHLDDLIDCGQGKTVISILTDINGFCAYENRERIAADQCQDDLE